MRLVELGVNITLLCLGFIFAAPEGTQTGSYNPSHKISMAGDLPISAGGFRFRIARVAFDTTAMGFVPEGMGPKDRLMFVEFELLSGNRDDFKGLVITVDRGSGRRAKAAVLASGGMMKALSDLTFKSVSIRYRPENANIAWAYVVQEDGTDFFLIFPTGEVIGLAPLIKEDRAEIARTSARGGRIKNPGGNAA